MDIKKLIIGGGEYEFISPVIICYNSKNLIPSKHNIIETPTKANLNKSINYLLSENLEEVDKTDDFIIFLDCEKINSDIETLKFFVKTINDQPFDKLNKSYIHIMNEYSEEMYFFNFREDFSDCNLIELFQLNNIQNECTLEVKCNSFNFAFSDFLESQYKLLENN